MAQQDIKGEQRFVDLPPEIRNLIYTFCLTLAGPVEIIRTSLLFKPRRVGLNPSHKAQLSPNILATCRIIHKEATPILYGMNFFKIHRHGSPMFLCKWGRQIKLVRQVELQRPVQSDFMSALHQLKKCKDLERLVIGVDVVDQWDADTLVKLFRPFMRHVHHQRKGTDKKGVMEVLEFKEECFDKEEHKKRVKDFREKIKVILEQGGLSGLHING